jgi:hypothetical protein
MHYFAEDYIANDRATRGSAPTFFRRFMRQNGECLFISLWITRRQLLD